jgi:3-dehydroquinate synthase
MTAHLSLPVFSPSLKQALERVDIELAQDRSYPIWIGQDLWANPNTWAALPKARLALVVSNTVVAPLYAQKLVETLKGQYERVELLVLPDGEHFKTWETMNLIFDRLLACGADRKTVLFALGGGVVGDITGFAAACFMRGVPFVQVPTTLLAQVDSSVGGKTAVNHPLGKNMVGAFYQPEQVVCDLGALQTLPARELSAGLAEIIKYGPIADMDFLAWLEDHLDLLLQKNPVALAVAVKRSCEIKAWVVSQDEKEGGLRAILNFGHTFGHAIESGLGFGEWLHGEAVGCGMVMACELSLALGRVDRAFVDRMRALIARAGLPTRAPDLGIETYLEHMSHDKKAIGGEIQFVVIDSPGHASVRRAAQEVVVQVIKQCVAL